MNARPLPVEVEEVRRRLLAGNGGYEIVHVSPGLEVGVYNRFTAYEGLSMLVIFARSSGSGSAQ